MTAWIIEPREPIIVRDGRPFNHQPGVMAATLPFPFPSTTAGAARGRAGSENGVFTASDDLAALKEIKVRGPLLAEYNAEEKWELLAPAPGDALLLEDEEELRCKQLVPLLPFEGSQHSSFRNGLDNKLSPVGQEAYEPEKPAKKQPAFWKWHMFEKWLLHPKQVCKSLAKEDLGLQPLPQEERVHVALERGMMVAREGALFETRGLEFTQQSDEGTKLAKARRLALWLEVEVEEHGKHKIYPGLDSLGGERRLVSWQTSGPSLKDFDALRAELSEQIIADNACRLILLTPAYFRDGYLPDVSQWEAGGVKLTLRAALVGRPQVVSGWDIEKKRPKPTQRLAPAGSVFFLKLAGEPENIRAWVEHTWMKCLSEEKQNSNDGFGLAILGIWDGEPKPMRLKEEKQ